MILDSLEAKSTHDIRPFVLWWSENSSELKLQLIKAADPASCPRHDPNRNYYGSQNELKMYKVNNAAYLERPKVVWMNLLPVKSPNQTLSCGEILSLVTTVWIMSLALWLGLTFIVMNCLPENPSKWIRNNCGLSSVVSDHSLCPTEKLSLH